MTRASKKRHLVSLTVGLALFVGSALPAGATPGSAVLLGTADVTPVDSKGAAGLGLPVQNDQFASWAFTADTLVAPATSVAPTKSVTPGEPDAEVSASGFLVGACGLSTGTGAGSYVIDQEGDDDFVGPADDPHGIVVFWKTSAGTILPVEGRYAGVSNGIGNHYKTVTPTDPLDDKSKDDGDFNSTGTIEAVVRAIATPDPVEACTTKGALLFDVQVAAVLVGT